MQLRELGASGLLVTPVCLGTMTFGDPVSEQDSIGLVHRAMDLGINFIDTANNYEGYARYLGSPGGVAETIVGKALKGRRDDVVLATKVAAPLGDGPQERGLSPSHILREIDRSLQRLQTDYVDLYIMHWPDKHVPLETTLSAMETIVRQGKARCIGASNFNAAQLCEMLWIADRQAGPRVVSSQIPYSMLRREFHHDLAFCERHNIGVTPYQPLQGGMLSGKYRRGEALPTDSRAAEKPEWMWDLDDRRFDQLEAIQTLANEVDVPMSQYALAWTLQQPAMSSLVVGVKQARHIEDAIAAASVKIPDEHAAKMDTICPPPWLQPDPIRAGQTL